MWWFLFLACGGTEVGKMSESRGSQVSPCFRDGHSKVLLRIILDIAVGAYVEVALS